MPDGAFGYIPTNGRVSGDNIFTRKVSLGGDNRFIESAVVDFFVNDQRTVMNNRVRLDGASSMRGTLNLGGHGLINLLAPTGASSATTKAYVDNLVDLLRIETTEAIENSQEGRLSVTENLSDVEDPEAALNALNGASLAHLQTLAAVFPAGMFLQSARQLNSAEWVEVNGQILVKADYPDLWTAIMGSSWISSATSTTFTLIDISGRVLAGVEGTNTAGTLAGEEDEVRPLTIDEMPTHGHDYTFQVVSVGSGRDGAFYDLRQHNNQQRRSTDTVGGGADIDFRQKTAYVYTYLFAGLNKVPEGAEFPNVIEGAKGRKGDKGDAGERGSAGTAGSIGETGTRGLDGLGVPSFDRTVGSDDLPTNALVLTNVGLTDGDTAFKNIAVLINRLITDGTIDVSGNNLEGNTPTRATLDTEQNLKFFNNATPAVELFEVNLGSLAFTIADGSITQAKLGDILQSRLVRSITPQITGIQVTLLDGIVQNHDLTALRTVFGRNAIISGVVNGGTINLIRNLGTPFSLNAAGLITDQSAQSFVALTVSGGVVTMTRNDGTTETFNQATGGGGGTPADGSITRAQLVLELQVFLETLAREVGTFNFRGTFVSKLGGYQHGTLCHFDELTGVTTVLGFTGLGGDLNLVPNCISGEGVNAFTTNTNVLLARTGKYVFGIRTTNYNGITTGDKIYYAQRVKGGVWDLIGHSLANRDQWYRVYELGFIEAGDQDPGGTGIGSEVDDHLAITVRLTHLSEIDFIKERQDELEERVSFKTATDARPQNTTGAEVDLDPNSAKVFIKRGDVWSPINSENAANSFLQASDPSVIEVAMPQPVENGGDEIRILENRYFPVLRTEWNNRRVLLQGDTQIVEGQLVYFGTFRMQGPRNRYFFFSTTPNPLDLTRIPIGVVTSDFNAGTRVAVVNFNLDSYGHRQQVEKKNLAGLTGARNLITRLEDRFEDAQGYDESTIRTFTAYVQQMGRMRFLRAIYDYEGAVDDAFHLTTVRLNTWFDEIADVPRVLVSLPQNAIQTLLIGDDIGTRRGNVTTDNKIIGYQASAQNVFLGVQASRLAVEAPLYLVQSLKGGAANSDGWTLTPTMADAHYKRPVGAIHHTGNTDAQNDAGFYICNFSFHDWWQRAWRLERAEPVVLTSNVSANTSFALTNPLPILTYGSITPAIFQSVVSELRPTGVSGQSREYIKINIPSSFEGLTATRFIVGVFPNTTLDLKVALTLDLSYKNITHVGSSVLLTHVFATRR